MAKIFIDPGHGGDDPGAVGNGLREKDLTLDISKRIRKYLNDNYTGHSIKMSRTNDKTVGLSERVRMANNWGADFFLSVHINAGGGTGYEDFIYNKSSDTSQTAKIRNAIHNEIVKQLGNIRNRGKKKANFAVLRETDMHAMLTENLFIDTKTDADKLKSNTFLDKVAEGHAEGIAKALGLKKGKTTQNKNKSSTTKTHTVNKGDTLYKIAKKYGTTVKKLKELNPKVIPEKLQIGEKIKVQGNATKKKTIPKKKYPLPSGVIGRGATGEKVLQIQKALSAVHFYPNKGAKNHGCDGIYGPKTANAVKRFQSVYVPHQTDGIYGNNTRKKLQAVLKSKGY